MDIDKIKVDLPKKKLNKMIHKEFRRQYVELLKEQEQEIERLNNIIDRSVRYLKIHGYYDNEIGRIVEELNDDECTELLQILEDNVKEEFEELKESK